MTTNAISQGETMTSSTHERSNVPVGLSSSLGDVYVSVATPGTPATVARTVALRLRLQQRAIRHEVLARELPPDALEDGNEVLGCRPRDERALAALRERLQALGLIPA